jgi:hypothetical protein
MPTSTCFLAAAAAAAMAGSRGVVSLKATF